MKRIDHYGRCFTVSDRFADGLVSYLNDAVTAGKPLREFFPVRCYTTDPARTLGVTVQVSGVPMLVYPADAVFGGVAEIEDDPAALERLGKRRGCPNATRYEPSVDGR
ncbi:hypothetical protein E3O42_16250 [Cryobacterium adonitolivorans]|uniref:Uncharacterized protein n=1 Tax=Cryobacterium adonitolivorans TaxID=1259189 RepID=A0A4R8VY79_9MICO|nr:hypothetical protein [Cryobacterium adonitolivorans]TFB97488.1 hypothetical protein E3O42_16250 [Cryobacterium adonitolivorans]